jgi:hypothetical protein
LRKSSGISAGGSLKDLFPDFLYGCFFIIRGNTCLFYLTKMRAFFDSMEPHVPDSDLHIPFSAETVDGRFINNVRAQTAAACPQIMQDHSPLFPQDPLFKFVTVSETDHFRRL